MELASKVEQIRDKLGKVITAPKKNWRPYAFEKVRILV